MGVIRPTELDRSARDHEPLPKPAEARSHLVLSPVWYRDDTCKWHPSASVAREHSCALATWRTSKAASLALVARSIIFRLEHERTISNDWVIRHEGRWYQLQWQSENYAPVKAKVTVYESQGGALSIEYRGRKLKFDEIAGPPVRAAAAVQKSPARLAQGHTPAVDHPWKRDYRGMKI